MTSHAAMLHTIQKKGVKSILNPLLNTSMICIEGTAAIVRGEVENQGQRRIYSIRKVKSNIINFFEKYDICCISIKRDVYQLIQLAYKLIFTVCDSGFCIPEDSYLCTGLDLYLSVEPDLMSSMALVHSRIRRVFYKYSCPLWGALGTHYNIHSLRSLNHHFRVYKVLHPT